MFEFKNKTILIISPQAWGKMYISKHHYAAELAKRGNLVYFLNPPIRQFFPKLLINKKHENLFLINYSFFFPYNLRFHFRKMFNLLQKIQLFFLLNKVKKPIDVVWCFDTNLFSDLSVFGNCLKIYHPVDNVAGQIQKSIIQSSDFIFSVSDIIIDKLKKITDKKNIHFINHGLSEYFVNFRKNKEVLKDKITAYFVGNILLKTLDRNAAKKIISENPNILFVFIGAYTSSNILSTVNIEAADFISFLKNSKNVTLKGSMHPKNILNEIKNADVLLVLIDPQKDINKGSNSHKILEYLSAGKVIVANHISSYANKRDLIEMVDEMHNDNLPGLFKKVINKLDYYNSPELQEKRIKFALDNTYENQIKRIEDYITKKQMF